jgi:hypothetical protein
MKRSAAVNVSNLMLELREPFPPAKVSWRIARVVNDEGEKGKAQVLAYIDARDVMERLDYICGVDGWQCRYSHTATKTVCDIGIRINGEWIWKSDGAGDTDVEAEKGALSDAFKRAAVRWGIGRYLYDLGNNYAEVTKKNKTWYITPEAQKTLEKMLPRGGTLKMEDARPLYAKLEAEMLKFSDPDMLKEWAFTDAIRADVLKLPAAWQSDFIEKYTHHKATLARVA